MTTAKYSLTTCESMNEESVSIAAETNQKYLESKSSLADMADKLERGPSQVIRASYNIKSQQLIEQYKQARNAASSVDNSLREYLAK